METGQVRAALGLLSKVLPDLVSAENKLEVAHRYVIEVPASLSNEEWQRKYGPVIEGEATPTVQ